MSSPIAIIALGSYGRSDDGVGLDVAERLTGTRDCRIVRGQDDAMGILNSWQGSKLAVVVDAAVSGAAPGSIHRLALGQKPLPRELARCSSHGVGLAEAVELGRAIACMPGELIIYGVEAANLDHGTQLTARVASAAIEVAALIQSDIDRYHSFIADVRSSLLSVAKEP